jgi:hypothetical protein
VRGRENLLKGGFMLFSRPNPIGRSEFDLLIVKTEHVKLAEQPTLYLRVVVEHEPCERAAAARIILDRFWHAYSTHVVLDTNMVKATLQTIEKNVEPFHDEIQQLRRAMLGSAVN